MFTGSRSIETRPFVKRHRASTPFLVFARRLPCSQGSQGKGGACVLENGQPEKSRTGVDTVAGQDCTSRAAPTWGPEEADRHPHPLHPIGVTHLHPDPHPPRHLRVMYSAPATDVYFLQDHPPTRDFVLSLRVGRGRGSTPGSDDESRVQGASFLSPSDEGFPYSLSRSGRSRSFGGALLEPRPC